MMSARKLVHLGTLVLILNFVVAIVACGRNSAPAARSDPDRAAPVEPDLDDVARLRALGYLEYEEDQPQPENGGVSILDPDRAQPGNTLIVYAGSCICDLVTLEGDIVNSWSATPCRRWYASVLLENGDLVVVGSDSDPDAPVEERLAGHYIMRLSWQGEMVWQRRVAAHHSIEVTPSGQLLTVIMKRRHAPPISGTEDVIDDVLALMSMDGEVIEELSLYDVLEGSTFDLPAVTTDGLAENIECCLDPFHTNSVKWVDVPQLTNENPMYEAGNVVVTSRNLDSVLVINWPRRELRWAWGRGQLSGPHDATILDDGDVLVFDNGLVRQRSRVVRLNPATGAMQIFNPPPQVEFFSRVMGACQQLDNGNLLITYSTGAQGFELTPDGSLAWAFTGTRRVTSGHRTKIARMTRLPSAPISAIVDPSDEDAKSPQSQP